MTFAAPVQRRLPIEIPVRRPLMSIDAVKGALDLNEDDVMHLIEDRQLPFAFDLRGPSAEKSYVRVWAKSVEEFRAGKKEIREPKASDVERVLNDILPPKKLLVTSDLERALNVVSQHVHNLIAARVLKAVPGTGNAINQSPIILRESAMALLRERRIS
jgi:hypothetical protein